jgi:hypothetical protein
VWESGGGLVVCEDGEAEAAHGSSLSRTRGPQRARSELASDWLDGVALCEAVKGFEEDETTIEMTILGLQSHQSQSTIFLLGGSDMVD